MRFLHGVTFAVGVLLCASFAGVGAKSSTPPQRWAQSNPGANVLRAVSDVQEPSSSVVPGANLTFSTIDVPGAAYTIAFGINTGGDIVGAYGQNESLDAHGFKYSNGTFTYFDYPGSNFTVPTGINDSGLIVGYAGQAPVVGFLYDGATFTTLVDGGDSATFARGINNAGVVVGGAGTIYATKAFRSRSGGQYRTINFPGTYIYGSANAINNLGEVVGYTVDGIDLSGYAIQNGKLHKVDPPGSVGTEAEGINDGGIIVGAVDEGPPYAFYAFAMMNGNYVLFSYPGAILTGAIGINNPGQTVGEYELADQTCHGFVTSPVSPATFR